jgi:hypothetical protein
LSPDFFTCSNLTLEKGLENNLKGDLVSGKKEQSNISCKNNLTYQSISAILSINNNLEDSNSNHSSFKKVHKFSSNLMNENYNSDLKDDLFGGKKEDNSNKILLEDLNSKEKLKQSNELDNEKYNLINDTSDEYYNFLHQEYEERERRFKQNYYAQKKKSFKEKESNPIIPCQFDFEAIDESKDTKIGKYDKTSLVK